jgi:NADPH:quinone reductase-like Zn-dependent oxidoreductase
VSASSPTRTRSQGLLDLVERGELTPHVQAAFPLERAADAHDELARGVRGKLVLVP